MQAITVSARTGAVIVRAAAAMGVSPGALRDLTGFDAASAADPDARISLELEAQLWDAAARISGDPLFGLHAAELLEPGAFDVLEYAARTAPTLREALGRLARYNRIEHDAAVFSLKRTPPTTRVEHSFPGSSQQPCRHAVEFTFASHLVIGSQMLARPFRPRAVELRHGPAAALDSYVQVFGVAPRFDAAVNALVWDDEVLDRALTTDPALSSIVTRHAEAVLAALPTAASTWRERVRDHIARNLGSGEVILTHTARQLKLSPRSLQRRLADEHTSFEGVLDELRRELALRYLDDSTLTTAEVAYLLGYSEPSPFHRAVRRWTGSTPNALRARSSAR
jgi:AraC-like DNA-binding protein